MAEPIDVLLVGPRVAQLKPHFEVRGYRCDAFPDGDLAMRALEAKHRDLVVLETNLGAQSAAEFVDRARASEPHAAYLLLDDPSRAGLIVKALQAGVTHYLPTPPDEVRLFRDVQALVTFARALSGQLEKDHELALADARADEERARRDAVETAMQCELAQQELATTTGERDGLKTEVASLKRRVDELRHQSIASASRLDEMAALTKEAEDLKRQRTVLEEQLEEAVRERSDERARAESLVEELKKSQDTAEGREHRIEELEGRLAKQTTLADERGRDLTRARAAVEVLETEKAALDERSIDLELQMDELQTKLTFAFEKQREAEARATEAEAHFKKERLRLIDEKQHAAAGSHEAWQKMEKMLTELAQLRAAKTAAEGRIAELEQRVKDAPVKT